jgi:[NiFe] hydrogenase assembly HybE family chaperone
MTALESGRDEERWRHTRQDGLGDDAAPPIRHRATDDGVARFGTGRPMSGLLPLVRVPAVRAPAAVRARAWSQDPSATVRAHFADVAATRMAGLPFVNPAIDVAVADCRRVAGDWLAALATPWCVALVLLPGGGALWQDGGAGERRRVRLPAGELVFVVDVGEARLPAFQYCPLVAPLHEVADTAVALQIARDALAAALLPPAAIAQDAAAASADAAFVSRRRFLRRMVPGAY